MLINKFFNEKNYEKNHHLQSFLESHGDLIEPSYKKGNISLK
jgi:hypothetical protein